MANLLLKPTVDAGSALTPAIVNPANGAIVSTEVVVLSASDTLSHEDEIEVSVTINGGTAGESVSAQVEGADAE